MIKIIPNEFISILVKIEDDEYLHSNNQNNYLNLIILDITNKIIDLGCIEKYIHSSSLYTIIKHVFSYYFINDSRVVRVHYPISCSHIITNDGEVIPIQLNEGWTFKNSEKIYYPKFKEINNVKTPNDSFKQIKDIFR